MVKLGEMADKTQDDMLREAARARGFRLVKSRRRKPGGDFGRYGLVGLESGRECLGFAPDGLTATAEEVHAYLRGGEVASWKRSLIGVVGEGEQPATTSPAARPRGSREASTPSRQRKAEPSRPEPERPAARPMHRPSTSRGGSEREEEPPGRSGPKSAALQPPKIREATRRDAAALAKLVGAPAPTLAERIAAAIKADEPPLVAETDGVIGVAAWTILPTLHEGPRGRVTLLLVAGEERRRGVGAALLAAVEQRLQEAGLAAVELQLDIDLDAPTAFLRRTGWQRTTNGYGKKPG